MVFNQKLFLTLVVLSLPTISFAQGLNTNAFIRTPQVINYNFGLEEAAYSPGVSIGLGLSHQSIFLELAAFINDDDLYGYYTFFGKTIKSKELSTNLNLYTNWFGEVAYIPKQTLNSDTFLYTTGLCYFLNHKFEWGSVGVPLCFGLAYSDHNLSLNTRVILNLSLNLN